MSKTSRSTFDPIDIANIGDDIGSIFGIGLGPDPSMWGDAYRMDVGSGGHNSYWDQNNPAMKNLGRIVIGEDGNTGVTPSR